MQMFGLQRMIVRPHHFTFDRQEVGRADDTKAALCEQGRRSSEQSHWILYVFDDVEQRDDVVWRATLLRGESRQIADESLHSEFFGHRSGVAADFDALRLPPRVRCRFREVTISRADIEQPRSCLDFASEELGDAANLAHQACGFFQAPTSLRAVASVAQAALVAFEVLFFVGKRLYQTPSAIDALREDSVLKRATADYAEIRVAAHAPVPDMIDGGIKGKSGLPGQWQRVPGMSWKDPRRCTAERVQRVFL